MSIERTSKKTPVEQQSVKEPSVEQPSLEPTCDMPLFDEQLPDQRCVDLEYLLLSLPASSWVITVRDTSTSLGEDLGGEECSEPEVDGKTRLGKFTGRRRL
jgi:hypothetical protein